MSPKWMKRWKSHFLRVIRQDGRWDETNGRGGRANPIRGSECRWGVLFSPFGRIGTVERLRRKGGARECSLWSYFPVDVADRALAQAECLRYLGFCTGVGECVEGRQSRYLGFCTGGGRVWRREAKRGRFAYFAFIPQGG
jgi:hypothetical protein